MKKRKSEPVVPEADDQKNFRDTLSKADRAYADAGTSLEKITAMGLAIESVLNFLRAGDLPGCIPLTDLLGELSNLCEGRQSLLRLPTKKGRPAQSLLKDALWANAAAAMTALIKHNSESENRAAAQVAAVMSKHKIPFPPRGTHSKVSPAVSLRNWRKNMLSLEYGKGAKKLHDEALAHAKKSVGKESIAAVILAILPQLWPNHKVL